MRKEGEAGGPVGVVAPLAKSVILNILSIHVETAFAVFAPLPPRSARRQPPKRTRRIAPRTVAAEEKRSFLPSSTDRGSYVTGTCAIR